MYFLVLWLCWLYYGLDFWFVVRCCLVGVSVCWAGYFAVLLLIVNCYLFRFCVVGLLQWFTFAWFWLDLVCVDFVCAVLCFRVVWLFDGSHG